MGSFALLLAALAVATAAALGDADVWRRHHHDTKVAAEAPAVLHKTPPSHRQEKKHSHAHEPLPRFAEGGAATTTTNHKKHAHPHHKLAHMPRFAEHRVSQHTRKTSAAASKASRKADGAAVKATGEADVAKATCANAGDNKAGKSKCKKAGARAEKASKSAAKSSDKAAEKWRKTGAAKAKAGDLAGSKAAYVDGERCGRDVGEMWERRER